MVQRRLSMGVPFLVIMNIITLLLCALANYVSSEINDIFPARILAQQKTVSENSDLYVTCSTFGSKKRNDVYVYLCKNDQGIYQKLQKQDQNDSTFIINSVGLRHSGNYSCVYSTRRYLSSKVARRGKNTIQILVIANSLPAEISVAGPSAVAEGADVELRCTVSDTLQTFSECQFIQSYLMKNERILQVQVFNVKGMEAAFTIEGAIVRDSGNYSCVVLPSKCIREHEETLYGKNQVLLEVKESWFPHEMIYWGVITMVFLLGLCLCGITKRAHSTVHNPVAESQRENAVVMLEEHQVMTEGEDLEAQDGGSFSTEEGEEYQNTVAAEDFINSEDCEELYSTVDDHVNLPRFYTTTSHQKNHQLQHLPDFT